MSTPSTTTQTAGELAFRAYAAAVGGTTVDGSVIPEWSDLGDAVRAGWDAAAAAVVPLEPGPVATPSADVARRRLAELVTAIAEPGAPADVRDLGIAIGTLTTAIDELETLDGRVYFERGRLDFWSRKLQPLLELLGEPGDGWSADVQRTYFDAIEGAVDELREDAGLERWRPSGPGLFERTADLEQRVAAAEQTAADAPAAAEAELEAERMSARARDAGLAQRLMNLDRLNPDGSGFAPAVRDELQALVAILTGSAPA